MEPWAADLLIFSRPVGHLKYYIVVTVNDECCIFCRDVDVTGVTSVNSSVIPAVQSMRLQWKRGTAKGNAPCPSSKL